ncbi:MAG: hypothetical protein QOI42_1704 [Frankiaceae bacterium]|jgi:hypothetical protein|nr:hypothetical protein [Frankiaceae bacterium]
MREPPGARPPWLSRHWHHLALLVVALLSGLHFRYTHGQSWHYFVTGARTLFCENAPSQACGLHVYASHPDLQIGPLSFVVAALVVWWPGDDGLKLACIAMMLAGLLALLIVEYNAYRSVERADRPRLQRRVFLAGLVFLPAWADLAVHFAHLDDVLALVFTAWAVRAVGRERPVEVGLALSLATISKPWAIAFLPLVLALPARRWTAAAYALIPTALVALPFLLADPHTLTAASFGIPNAAASALRVLGVSSPLTPQWDRPAQFALGMLLGVLAVRRQRWPAIVMVAATARIVLDPGVYSYYTAALLLGTLIWDLQARRGRVIPIWTWAVFAALFAARYLPVQPAVLGVVRLAVCAGIVICALVVSRPVGRMLAALPVPLTAGAGSRDQGDRPRGSRMLGALRRKGALHDSRRAPAAPGVADRRSRARVPPAS